MRCDVIASASTHAVPNGKFCALIAGHLPRKAV